MNRQTEFHMSPEEARDFGKVSIVRIKMYTLVILGLIHVLATLFFIVPGYISIDEVVYHWASKDFQRTWGFEIWNGYDEFPSPETYHHFVPPYKGRLVMQYPYLFPIVAWPFYRVAGFFGLFLVNAISFVGVVALCYTTARRLFQDLDLALNACIILTVGTFAWEYSQAAWPHVTSMLLIIGAFYLFVCSYGTRDRFKSLCLALASGLVAGFAPSLRMEGVLLFPALVLPFLFTRPWRPREALAVIAGTVPGLGTFALVNDVKFGALSPFTYGGPPPFSVHLAAALVALLFILWVLTRAASDGFVQRHRTKIYVAAAAVFVALMVAPPTRSLMVNSFINGWVSIIDIRELDPNLVLPAMGRSAGGGVIYIGGQKKALVQSLPFLAILVVPLAAIVRRHTDYPALLMLFVMPVTTVGYYAYAFYDSLAYAGGLCLNYRYALPLLPFLAILSAYGVREMKARWGKPLRFITSAVICFLTSAVFFLLVRKLAANVNDLEFPLLGLPLIIAGAFLVMLVLGEVVHGPQFRLLAPSVWAMFVVALTWSCLVALFYDYPLHRDQRARNYYVGESLRQVVAPDSIFFTAPVIDPFMRLIENTRVRIAFPNRDRFKDFPKLLEFHLKSGRRAYGAFHEAVWNRLKEGPLAGYVVTPKFSPLPGFWVSEIHLPHNSGQSPAK